ncbi:MAG: heme-binding protein [Acidimicrobiia bacterium]|nr:heme-binding protein [Acidimicrobiia bacterium]
MSGTPPLGLETARQISHRVLDWGEEHETGALTVAVLDTGGHPIVVERSDGSEFLRIDICIGKAWGALGMGVPGRLLAEKAAHAPHFVAALSAASHGRMVPVPGGVLVRRDGEIIGAVGVSGDTSDVDEEAAIDAVEGAGLQADFGQVEEWRRP